MRSWRRALLPVGVVAFCLFGQMAYGQAVDTAWVRTALGSSDSTDGGRAIAVDADGNVLVAGFQMNTGTNVDFVTLKYDPNGTLLWSETYDGPASGNDRPYAILVDAAGNSYVTGVSAGSGTLSDYTTLKYDPSGNLLWEKRYNGPGSQNDSAWAMAMDGAGNILVTGMSYSPGSGYDYLTIKYNPSGDTIWTRRYNGTGSTLDGAEAIHVDGSDNVYVTGRSNGIGTFTDYLTIKYNSSGVMQWNRRYNGPGNVHDKGVAVATDASANVIVTGRSWSNTVRDDAATLKYDASGTLLWERRFNGAADNDDYANALAIDPFDNIIVVGAGHDTNSVNLDILAIKYDPSGNILWQRWVDNIYNQDDIGYGVDLDTASSVYIVGHSWLASRDLTTIKYSAGGDLRWVKYIHGAGDWHDVGRAIHVDGQLSVYVTGDSWGPGDDYDIMTAKYVALPCGCPNQGDAEPDGLVTAVDLSFIIDAVFFAGPEDQDPACPTTRYDFNCDLVTDATDLAGWIDYVFFAGPGACDPCPL
ncbi:MAG: hypothetical protein AB1752_13355 [Candidatus Zixiibacteriota bacterium]